MYKPTTYAKLFWGKVNSFYCVLALCILSDLILTTLGGWPSFHFTIKKKNRKRISYIAQVVHLLNLSKSIKDFCGLIEEIKTM